MPIFFIGFCALHRSDDLEAATHTGPISPEPIADIARIANFKRARTLL